MIVTPTRPYAHRCQRVIHRTTAAVQKDERTRRVPCTRGGQLSSKRVHSQLAIQARAGEWPAYAIVPGKVLLAICS